MKRMLAAAGALLLLMAPVHAQEKTLKFGHAAASKHLFQDGMQIFADKVAAKTNGALKIEIYGDRQLGDDKQLLEGLQIGTIDGALVSTPTIPLSLGLVGFDALQLPFTVASYEDMSAALTAPIGQKLLDSLEGSSIKGLGYVEAGQRHFLSRTKPVATLADFAGLKTRIVPIPLHKTTWEAVGVSPIGMAYGEVYSALETGTIDAVEINLSSVRTESLYQTAKHATLTGHYFWPGAIMMSEMGFDALSPEMQKALVEAGAETTAEAYKLASAQEAETIAFLKENGVTVTELADLAEMRATTQPVVDAWLAKDPLVREFYDQVKSGN